MNSKPILIIYLFLILYCLCDAKFHMQTTIHDESTNTCTGNINMNPFIQIGMNYYFIEDKHKVNWYGAAHNCRTMAASLASIESAAEWQALSEYLLAHGYSGDHWFWVSGNDLENEGSFKWLSTGQTMYFSNWSPGQPDNWQGNENCIHLWQKKGFQMNDRDCKYLNYYICEVDVPKTVSLTFW